MQWQNSPYGFGITFSMQGLVAIAFVLAILKVGIDALLRKNQPTG
ncbi:MAG: hypothetical protein AAF921_11270 [Cyanobacteria bacterium P01_D01_bin.44]